VIVACLTGIGPSEWLDDPRALATAERFLIEQAEAQRKAR
jgi:hypothetical protein